MSDAEVLEILQTCLGAVLSLKEDIKKGKEESYQDHVENELMLTTALLSLEELLIEILAKDLTADTLETMIQASNLLAK